jgi:Fe-S cluster assembly iron-binding protein IscA
MTENETAVAITETAASKVLELLEREVEGSNGEHEGKAYSLRVAVQPGGCAGLRYALYFDDRKLDDDVVASHHGVRYGAAYAASRQSEHQQQVDQLVRNPGPEPGFDAASAKVAYV